VQRNLRFDVFAEIGYSSLAHHMRVCVCVTKSGRLPQPSRQNGKNSGREREREGKKRQERDIREGVRSGIVRTTEMKYLRGRG